MHQFGRHRGRVAVIATLTILVASAAGLWATGRLDGRLDWRSAAFWAGLRDTYKLDAPIQLVAEPPITLERGLISLPNSSGASRTVDTVADVVEKGGAEMALTGALLKIDLSQGTSDENSAEPSEAFERIMAAVKQLKFSAIAVNSSKIVIRRANGKSEVFSDFIGELATGSDNAVNVIASATYRDERLNLNATLTPALSDGTSVKRLPVRATINGDLLRASFDGRLALGKALKLDAERAELTVPDIREVAEWLKLRLPDSNGLKDFRASGLAEWSNSTLAFENAAIEMDGNAGYGSLSLNIDRGRPAFDGTLAFATFDLSPYFPDISATASSTANAMDAWFPLALASDLMSGNVLAGLDADLRVSADAIRLGDTAVRRSAATIAIKDGKLQADIAELELEGQARGSGEILVDMTQVEPNINVRGKIENVDLGGITQSVLKHPVLTGRGVVTVDLSSHGVARDVFLETLNGKLALSLADEGRLGLDVDTLTQGARNDSQSGMSDALMWAKAGQGSMPINQFDARFEVANGILATEKLAAVASGRTVEATGTVDLPNGTMNLTVSVAPQAPAAAGADTASASPPPPVTPTDVLRITGPWARPTLEPGRAPPRKADLPQPATADRTVR